MHVVAAKKRSPAASIRIKKTSHDKRHGRLSCTENETSRLRHKGRLPRPPFFFVRRTIPLFLQGRLFMGHMETEVMVFESVQIGGV